MAAPAPNSIQGLLFTKVLTNAAGVVALKVMPTVRCTPAQAANHLDPPAAPDLEQVQGSSLDQITDPDLDLDHDPDLVQGIGMNLDPTTNLAQDLVTYGQPTGHQAGSVTTILMALMHEIASASGAAAATTVAVGAGAGVEVVV